MIRSVASPFVGVAPHHVAIVMDGTRDWSAFHGAAPAEGVRRSLRALQRTVAAAARCGVGVLTVHAFADHAWDQPTADTTLLMEATRVVARRVTDTLLRANVQVKLLGRRDRLAPSVSDALGELEARTAGATGMLLNLAVDYAARTEVCAALRAIALDVAAGRLRPDEIDDDAIASRLETAGLPDPDLLIRTGGDLRLANFMLYQCAYTELWATRTPWPDFDGAAFEAALVAYAGRQRRFGR